MRMRIRLRLKFFEEKLVNPEGLQTAVIKMCTKIIPQKVEIRRKTLWWLKRFLENGTAKIETPNFEKLRRLLLRSRKISFYYNFERKKNKKTGILKNLNH